MLTIRFVLAMLPSALAILAVGGPVSAQTYPNKPIRIITVGVGTTNDFIARLIAQGLAEPLGQQVMV